MSWKGGGRSVRDEAEARACFAAMEAAGTTVYGYAVAHGVSASSLYRWRNRLGIETPEAEPVGRRPAPAPSAADVPGEHARPVPRSPADEDEARSLLGAFTAEGGDLAAFCRVRGLSTDAMYRWRARLATEGEVDAVGGPRLVEVCATPAPRARYELRVRGVRVLVDDDFRDETLARLLRVARAC
jgi:transposase-like protein